MAATRKTTTRSVPSKPRATRVAKGAVRAKTSATSKKDAALRKQAEARLRTTKRDVAAMPVQDVHRLVHELQVHQIELEMQNEELRRTQVELEAAREHYRELYYDSAPIGYLTVDPTGMILKANLPACTVLRRNRNELLGTSVIGCVAAKDQGTFRRHLREVVRTGGRHTCDVDFLQQDDAPVSVQCESVIVQDAAGQQARVRTALLDITARKQTEDALRERERLFHTLAQVAPVGIFHTDATGGCLYVNDRWCEIAGMSADTAAGFGWTSAIHPDDRDRVAREWTRAVRSQRPFLSEFRFQPVDRPITWVIGQAQAERDQHGEVVGYVGTMTDITARKQAETALRTLNTRLDFLLSSSPATIYTCEAVPPYAPTFISANVTGLLGYAAMDFLATPGFWANHIHPDDYDRVFAGLPCLFATGTHLHEYRFQHKDGRWRWVSDALHVVPGSDGTASELIGYFIDITERKEAEEARRESETRLRALNANLDHVVTVRTGELRESEVRLRTLFEQAAVGVAEIDTATGRFLRVNHTYGEILGYSVEEMRALDFMTITHPNDLASDLAQMEQVTRGERREFTLEKRYLRKDGSIVWVDLTVSPLWGPTEAPTRHMAVVKDITTRKQVEDALRNREHEFHLLADNVPAFYASIDRELRYRYVNKRYEESFGPSTSDMVGRLVKDVVGEHNFHTIEPHLREAFLGQEVSCTYPLVLPNGDARWIHVQYMPDGDDTGRIRGVLALGTDVTARKQVELALQQSQLVLQEKREALQALAEKLLMAQDEERKRIARDLHDDFNQRLAALSVELESLERAPIAPPEPMGRQLAAIRVQVGQLSDDLHALAYRLHPSLLEHVGLEVALRDHAVEFTKRTGLPVTFDARQVPASLSQEIATNVFRVIQESLQNVFKHAQATEVTVRLRGSSKGIGISVRDNGTGFDREKTNEWVRGLGLVSMQERARGLGGFLRIHSLPRIGTKIYAWIPHVQKGA